MQHLNPRIRQLKDLSVQQGGVHLKEFYTSFSLYLENLFIHGVHFYFFTIMDYQTEPWGGPDKACRSFAAFLNRIELIEFSYFSLEHSPQSQIPHLHGLIGVRSIIGRNPSMFYSLKQYLSEAYFDLDFRPVENIPSLFLTFNYVVKQHRFPSHYIVYHRSIALESESEAMLDRMTECGIRQQANFLSLRTPYWDIMNNGLGRTAAHQRNVVIYLFNLYLSLNQIVYYKDSLYKKDPDSRCTWLFLDKVSYLQDNFASIILFLKNKFPLQLGLVDLQTFFYNELNAAMRMLKQVPNLLWSAIIAHNVIEFVDGLYFLDQDYFLSFYKNKNMDFSHIKVYRRYDVCYRRLSKPDTWIHLLSKNDSLKDSNQLTDFCVSLGRYFQSEHIEDKKNRSLYLVGASNTGKTTLITNVLIEAKGLENIGQINNSDNFAFENVIDKNLILSDEFEYNSSNRSDLLKLITGEPVSLNRKFMSHTPLTQINVPIIFMSNHTSASEIMFKDAAFFNRLIIIILNSVIGELTEEDKYRLKKEIPHIIVYCNRLFYEQIKKPFINRKNAIKDLKQQLLKIDQK